MGSGLDSQAAVTTCIICTCLVNLVAQVPLAGNCLEGTAMGNAPLCHSCHTNKGIPSNTKYRDLDTYPDYYTEICKEPEALVSLLLIKSEVTCLKNDPIHRYEVELNK